MRAGPATEAVEPGAGEEPIKSPIGSARRAAAAACLRPRAGAISIVRTGEVPNRPAAVAPEDAALARLLEVCTVGLAKNGAG